MKITHIRGGDVRQRRSFRLLTPVVFIGFSAAAMFVAIDGFANQGVDEIRAGALVMAVGAFCVRITRSRVHLREQSLVIVNPLFWFDLPYKDIYRAEVSNGGSLVVRLKEDGDDEEGPLAVGFAGSLLDRYFKTTDRVVREINKRKKKASEGVGPVQSRGIALDLVADFQIVCSAALLFSSVFV